MSPDAVKVIKTVLVAFIGALASIVISHLEDDEDQDHDQGY